MLVKTTVPLVLVNVLGSLTANPIVVGKDGVDNPDSMRGIASHVMIDVPMASHVTVPSITVLPNTVGHVGCVPPEMPEEGCTASYKKFVIVEGVSKDHFISPTKAVLNPVPA